MAIARTSYQTAAQSIRTTQNMTENEIIKAYLSRLGRKGGSVKGPQKVRPREHYQKAVGIRWAKYRERQQTGAQASKR